MQWIVKNNMKLRTYILFFICLLSNFYSKAQSVDSLFKAAREFAFNGEKVKARSICDDILKKSPNYNEVRVLKGRTYSWDGMRDSARIEFYQVLANDSTETEAWLALSDLEFWDDKPQASLFAAENGLKYAPDNKEFILKKIRANIELKNYEQAEKDLNQLKEKSGFPNKEVHLMRNFASGSLGLPVPDPYYGGEKEFEEVFTILDEALDGFLNHLKEVHPLIFENSEELL